MLLDGNTNFIVNLTLIFNSSSDASLSSNLSAIVMSSDVGSMSLGKKSDSELNIEKPDLASFLIHRACENITLANYFYW